MKYQYQEFVNRRDIENIVHNSIPVLEACGIDPATFYNGIIENPEILQNEEALNELLGWAKDAASAVGAGMKGAWAGDQARRTRNDLDAINKMTPAQQAQYGFNPEKIKDIEAQQKSQSAQYGRGFFGNVADKWNAARTDRNAQALQARYGGMANKYGATPGAAPASPATPTPATPAAPATPAPAPAAASSGGTVGSMADQLQKSIGFDDKAKASLVKLLDKFLKGLGNP